MFNPDFQHKKILFPQLTRPYTEDPFLYIDCDGNYHAILHNMSPLNDQTVCGGHAFSEDGVNWIYAGTSYDNIIHYEDNTNFIAKRRERPHFIFKDDRCTPIALLTSVWLGGGQFGDRATLNLQPIKH
eukprot:UN10728